MILYENELTFSKGAFTLNNTGMINQGWVIDPILNQASEIFTLNLLSFINDITESVTLDRINEIYNGYLQNDINVVINSEDLSSMTQSNIDLYVQIIYNNLLGLTNNNTLFIPNTLSIINDPSLILSNINTALSSEVQIDNYISTMDLTNLTSVDQADFYLYINDVYNNI